MCTAVLELTTHTVDRKTQLQWCQIAWRYLYCSVDWRYMYIVRVRVLGLCWVSCVHSQLGYWCTWLAVCIASVLFSSNLPDEASLGNWVGLQACRSYLPSLPSVPHPVLLSRTLIYLKMMSNKRQVAHFLSSRDWKCPVRVDRRQSWENRKIFSYAIDALDFAGHLVTRCRPDLAHGPEFVQCTTVLNVSYKWH